MTANDNKNTDDASLMLDQLREFIANSKKVMAALRRENDTLIAENKNLRRKLGKLYL